MSKTALERELRSLSKVEMESAVEKCTEEELIQLLDSRYIRIGDVAAMVLHSSGRHDLIVDCLVAGTIRTALGRVRATNMLHWRGKRCSRSVEAYLALLKDKSARVLYNALFGLVFLQDESNLPAIVAEAGRRAAKGGRAHEALLRAVRAIENRDPFVFSPGYMDAYDDWELDPVRFPGRCAPEPQQQGQIPQ